ncbi:hypothetical protein CGLO_12803 [Colletotrichum gloeosporioides Cg-14]|uniref:Uncharacterized protein n=1 Tax=Colletotrichum gloeosporioides (strain Cg-14) TaxID=1237896 RepID=T0L8R4_COLGC|nr:hypothetical protein CGLO_12803 [Colletotrichum gloeosporioides Cg-14]
MGSFVEELLSDICNLEKAPEVPRLNRGVSTKHAFNYLAYARGSKQKTTKPGSARWMLDYRQKRALRRWLRNTYNLWSLSPDDDANLTTGSEDPGRMDGVVPCAHHGLNLKLRASSFIVETILSLKTISLPSGKTDPGSSYLINA